MVTEHLLDPGSAVLLPAGQGVQPGAGAVLLPAADVAPMGQAPQVASRPLPAGQIGTGQAADPGADLVKPAGQNLQPGAGLVGVPADEVLPTAHGLQAGPVPLPAGQMVTLQEAEAANSVVVPAGQYLRPCTGLVALPGSDHLPMPHAAQLALRP